MAKPAFLYDNRYAEGTLTASSTAAGFDIADLADWRPYTSWKAGAASTIVKTDLASLAYEFTASADGWSGVNATLTTNPTFLNVLATTTDPQILSPSGLTIDGAVERYIVARIRRNAGSGWEGSAFYINAAHGSSANHRKTIADPTGGTPGSWVLAIWDMHDLTAGGDDWENGVTSRIRLDLGATATDDFDVDWITLQAGLSADYCLFWGHDFATQGVTATVRGSDDDFATSTILATLTPTSNRPFAAFFTAGSYRHFGMNIVGAVAPTIAIAAIGELLEAPQGLGSGFDPLTRRPMGKLSTSVGGHPLGRAIDYEEWRQTLTFPFVGWDWLRDTWQPAWTAHLRDDPFVLAWDRVGKPEELHLVAAAGGFETPHRKAVADLSLEVLGVALAR
ncbi:MAG: hypothetical protein OEU09_13820 [Rhodospirillales bacterium]|nr:hypothetical protein [Rhodospirillales bacterium]MDH3912366.1 hypothetical protein [Rhodospirillales bacterium]